MIAIRSTRSKIFVEQYRAIPGAALHVLPNAGHDAVFGAGRAEFVRAALEFLDAEVVSGAGARERLAERGANAVACWDVHVRDRRVALGQVGVRAPARVGAGAAALALRRAAHRG